MVDQGRRHPCDGGAPADRDRLLSAGTARVTGLVRKHQYVRYRKVLACARNVWDALLEEFPDSPWRPWKPGVAELAGIEVAVFSDGASVVARRVIPPTVVFPGDTLRVTFEAEDFGDAALDRSWVSAADRVAYAAGDLNLVLALVSARTKRLEERLRRAAERGVSRADAETLTAPLEGIDVKGMLDRAYGPKEEER